MYKVHILILLTIISFPFSSNAQCKGWGKLHTIDSVFTNPAFGITTSPEADKLHRPYEYLATVSGGGVKIYDNKTDGNPTLVATIVKSSLGNLDAINLFQDSIWLYVCLGNSWNTSEKAGLAIVDVSNPLIPKVLNVYTHNGKTGGSSSVFITKNYAYLAANQNGLLILDISNKSKITLKSSLAFSTNFPHSMLGETTLYNARGITLKDNYAYVCFDRGGLRIVDVSNVNAPVQVSQYCFSNLINKVTAYNNIVIHQNLAYIAIDYYGMEIVDISNPKQVKQIGWWHPSSWADTTNNFTTWANSKGHANEIAFDSNCNKIYLAAGKSDIVAIDVQNPTNPTTCELFGSDTDDYGSWGMDYFDGKIHVAYIWSTFAPPYSNYTGYKILQTNCSTASSKELDSYSNTISIYPNPTSGQVHFDVKEQDLLNISIYNLQGELVTEHFSNDFSISELPDGIYMAVIQTDKYSYRQKISKE